MEFDQPILAGLSTTSKNLITSGWIQLGYHKIHPQGGET